MFVELAVFIMHAVNSFASFCLRFVITKSGIHFKYHWIQTRTSVRVELESIRADILILTTIISSDIFWIHVSLH